jgi:hypothetical protein
MTKQSLYSLGMTLLIVCLLLFLAFGGWQLFTALPGEFEKFVADDKAYRGAVFALLIFIALHVGWRKP